MDKDEGIMCCYIKLKFENDNVDEKFTHEGCYELKVSLENFKADDDDIFDFDEDVIDYIEGEFDTAYKDQKIYSKKVSVDCSSKYLTLAGFALLFMLL